MPGRQMKFNPCISFLLLRKLQQNQSLKTIYVLLSWSLHGPGVQAPRAWFFCSGYHLGWVLIWGWGPSSKFVASGQNLVPWAWRAESHSIWFCCHPVLFATWQFASSGSSRKCLLLLLTSLSYNPRFKGLTWLGRAHPEKSPFGLI